ncbi:YjcZ family sporulation protein [Ureibacillus thermophilus]|uniref:YjcZ family sporulation protein n=1 Tax=Ureibacillus thermophilus TaxID=367743 RepID=A0A4P6UUE2_9BACL|nr:YjcZ family sporulation protein [Ureibacillus thermophilus]QBK26427.1 YjcZ family sporulation protein [Ureibacillus thermophilus]
MGYKYCNYGYSGGGFCNSFALLVVLFILLIIIGSSFGNKGYYC